jgi:hypothetical protein
VHACECCWALKAQAASPLSSRYATQQSALGYCRCRMHSSVQVKHCSSSTRCCPEHRVSMLVTWLADACMCGVLSLSSRSASVTPTQQCASQYTHTTWDLLPSITPEHTHTHTPCCALICQLLKMLELLLLLLVCRPGGLSGAEPDCGWPGGLHHVCAGKGRKQHQTRYDSPCTSKGSSKGNSQSACMY